MGHDEYDDAMPVVNPDGSPTAATLAMFRTVCQWWFMCENQAVQTRPHPILGHVPICERCNTLVESLSR